MIPRSLFKPLLSLCLATGFACADTIQLNSGELIRGTITAEDAKSVTIEFEVSKGIRDEKVVPRSEIQSTVKEDPGDKVWFQIAEILPTPDLLGEGDYLVLIQKVDTFVRAHPSHRKTAEARRLIDTLKDERAKVANGGVKVEGVWLTPEQYQRDKYWVDGRIATKQLQETGKTARTVDALRQFEKIEANYKGTTTYSKAVEVALLVLRRYHSALTEAIATQPHLETQRNAGLASMTPEDRKVSEAALAAENEAHKLRVEDEKKSGTKWLTLDAYDMSGLNQAITLVESEQARLTALNLADTAELEASLRQIDLAINEGRIDAANMLIQKVSKNLSGTPYLKSLDSRVKSEVARLQDEKRAADLARAEAAKKAAEATAAAKLPVVPPKEEDPLEKELVNPVTRAVQESELGKRATNDFPKATTNPKSTEEASESATNTPETGKKPAKSGAAGLNKTLFTVAGVLAVLFVALLLVPVFKKKHASAPDGTSSDGNNAPGDGHGANGES